jgi:hypothetical protein
MLSSVVCIALLLHMHPIPKYRHVASNEIKNRTVSMIWTLWVKNSNYVCFFSLICCIVAIPYYGNKVKTFICVCHFISRDVNIRTRHLKPGQACLNGRITIHKYKYHIGKPPIYSLTAFFSSTFCLGIFHSPGCIVLHSFTPWCKKHIEGVPTFSFPTVLDFVTKVDSLLPKPVR